MLRPTIDDTLPEPVAEKLRTVLLWAYDRAKRDVERYPAFNPDKRLVGEIYFFAARAAADAARENDPALPALVKLRNVAEERWRGIS